VPAAACRWECDGTQLAQQALRACIIHLQRRDDRAADVSLAVQALSTVFSVDVLSGVDGANGAISAGALPEGCALYPRWKMTKAEVASLGISDREAKRVAGMMWVHDLRAGEIACTLSHVSAWRRAARGGATTLAVFEDDCTLSDAGVINIVAALQALRSVQWDILRLGRSDADPLGPVADDGEEVARFNALVSDDDCPDTHTGAKRKRSSSPRVLRVPLIRASGSWTGAYLLSQRGLARLAHCGLEQSIMNVDDFLFACSVDHPRCDLIRSAPVQNVRLQGPFVSLAIASALQRAVFGVDMTETSKRGDCF
jgi:GR25 family glycosyltransferase involved in LPS biosynthesis